MQKDIGFLSAPPPILPPLPVGVLGRGFLALLLALLVGA